MDRRFILQTYKKIRISPYHKKSYLCKPVEKTLHIGLIGAGNRASKYVTCLPAGVLVKAVVDPDVLRRERLLKSCPEAKGYAHMADIPASEALDAVIVAAPDRLHVPIGKEAAKRGWHILMEKPVAQSLAEYRELMADTAGITVGVCLEMRLHPYYRRVKELIPRLGRILSVHHTEKIGADRMSHSFVRGLWASHQTAGPIFLSKCCHDTDFLLWALGGSAVEVRSKGSLQRFKASAAPKASTERCFTCPLKDCPYNAVRLYRERQAWTNGFTPAAGKTLAQEIERQLQEGPFGRCVYHCDNNVNDYQEVDVTLDSGTQLHICLDGLSIEEGRITLIEGTEGTLKAQNWHIYLNDILVEDCSHLALAPLHAGADQALIEDFFRAIRTGGRPAATLEEALPAHQICYLAG